MSLGLAAVAAAVGLAVWLWSGAGSGAAAAALVGGIGVAGVAAGVATARFDAVAVGLACLGGAYAAVLAIADPQLDLSAALVAAALLTIGELAHLSIDARTAVDTESVTWRRTAWVAVLALGTLALGAGLLVVSDLLRTGGIAVDVLGAVAALAALGLLVAAARDAANG